MPIALTMALEIVAVAFGALSMVAVSIALLLGNKKVLQRDLSIDFVEILRNDGAPIGTLVERIRALLPSVLSAVPVIYGVLVVLLVASDLATPATRTISYLTEWLGI